jgi:hypothetical protein
MDRSLRKSVQETYPASGEQLKLTVDEFSLTEIIGFCENILQ